MLKWHHEWPHLFEKIIWSDEAVFLINSFVRLRNCFLWAKGNLKLKVLFPKFQKRQKLPVWCGFTATQVIGSVIMRDSTNAERCLRMLSDQVWPFVNNQGHLISIQDGAPATATMQLLFASGWTSISRADGLADEYHMNGHQEALPSLRMISFYEDG